MTGAGKIGESGGDPADCFSLKLDRAEDTVEQLEEFDDIDRLVSLRSRIFSNVCIKRPKSRKDGTECYAKLGEERLSRSYPHPPCPAAR